MLHFFHRDLLVDIEHSDPDSAMKMFQHELMSGSIRLPLRFGRALYDNFNDIPGNSRVEHLEPEHVDTLLQGTEQGIYQMGQFVTGPLGIIESKEKRFIPPIQRIPLWHCSDPGCQQLHSVEFLKHEAPAYSLAKEIGRAADVLEGPPSDWDYAMSRIQPNVLSTKGRDYYDIATLIAEAMTASERAELITRTFKENVGPFLRTTLRSTIGGRMFGQGGPESIVGRLSDGSILQLLMALTDAELVKMLDITVRERLIKIPPAETRSAKVHPPTLSNYDASSTLSIFGVRSERRTPILFLSSTIWNEYERTGQLTDLAWRCKMGAAAPKPGEPMEYMRNHTAREVVRTLILPSRPITLAIANKLQMELIDSEPEDQLIDRFLWKFGFNSARYGNKYQRFRMQLEQLREESIGAPTRLTDDHRDAIRSKGVNVFVSLENFIEELISFNVWILASDHISDTHFKYKFEDAVALVPTTLGLSKTIGDQVFAWRSGGGNVLGTLLIYARLAADWMLSLPTADRARVAKVASNSPHFAHDPARRFPFRHRELWADASTNDLKEYAEQFESLVVQLERSHLAEVRNGLDHYREEHKFPAIDLIVACESRLSSTLDSADLNRFIPKAYWLTESARDEFGMVYNTLQDYKGRKLILNGPAVLSGLRTPTFSRPSIVPYGNLLGYSNSELIFHLIEESPYSKMWANYPRRRQDLRNIGHNEEEVVENVSTEVVSTSE
jgi:hypothetical protein